MQFDLLKRREFMGYRGVIGSFVLTAAMMMATSGTRAHDEVKYTLIGRARGCGLTTSRAVHLIRASGRAGHNNLR